MNIKEKVQDHTSTEEWIDDRRKWIDETKQWLKSTAIKIKKAKSEFKDIQRANQGISWKDYRKVADLRYDFRHRLIAYCVVRGVERDRIEKPSEDNLPDEDYISRLVICYAR